jgi:hypothetical protein
VRGRAVVVAFVSAAILAAPAAAFDTGPHADQTVSGMLDEGFGYPAAQIARLNNWWVDMYTSASKIPFSGHADWKKVALAGDLGYNEHWSQDILDTVSELHWDPRGNNSTPDGIESQWHKLELNTRLAVIQAKTADHPSLALLSVIGASLHAVQDFYAHSNWVEPSGPAPFDGPGWAAAGYGSAPTWFDVPQPVRDASAVYVAAQNYTDGPPIRRIHGSWQADPARALAKDWPGRPYYTEAFEAAYFASRQWIEEIHKWVGDEQLWGATQAYSDHAAAIGADLTGARGMSVYAGRQYGEGGPCTPGCDEYSGDGGDLLSLSGSTKAYFEFTGRTILRRVFENQITKLGVLHPLEVADAAELEPPSSEPIQSQEQFVRLRTARMTALHLGDIGTGADMYQHIKIAGQSYDSPEIPGHDDFKFPAPYAPFTFIKPLSTSARFHPPITAITVTVQTADKRFAGTDDDVYLKLGPGLRFPLDKRLYDDFERGDTDTYSVPIDREASRGLSIGDIRYVEIQKSSDGLGGSWRLEGVEVHVNGRLLIGDHRIDRWLEDDHRSWRTPVTGDHRTDVALPVWFDIWDDDLHSPDLGDINPYDARDNVVVAYTPGTTVARKAQGGYRLEGRAGKGGDTARVNYVIDTLRPVVPAPPAPTPTPTPTPSASPTATPTPAPRPDLVISSLTTENVTVVNQGAGAAGAFSISLDGFSPIAVSGLAGGASKQIAYGDGCNHGTMFTARADAAGQVAESDETNNARTIDSTCFTRASPR